MTYREMFAQMTEEQLDQDVTIYSVDIDEFYKAKLMVTNEDDILDEGHVYLMYEDDFVDDIEPYTFDSEWN